MEAAATGGAGGPIKGDLPWERPIRQITLAARADVLDEMADPWKQYIKAIDNCRDQLGEIWDTVLDKQWKGEAAEACHRYWGTLQQEIRGFSENYDGVSGVLRSTGKAITEATHAIPIPVFSGDSLPGENGTGGDGANINGNMLYDDYQNYRGGYADFAFLNKALKEDANPSAERTYSKKSGYGTRRDEDKAYSDRDELVRKAAIENWYGENQNTANQAHDKLVTDYAHVIHSLPKIYGKFHDPSGSDGTGKHPGDGHHPGGGDGSDLSYSAGSFGAVGGAGLGAGAMHASPPPAARHSVMPSPPSSVTDGIRLAGDPDPSGVGTVGGSSLSGGSGSRLPLSWSTAGGSGGAGSFGAVGAGAGFGGAGVPPSVPEDGWWNRSPSGPMGPAAPTPAAKLAAARPGAAGASGSNGVGMMPHGGSGGNRQRDERQTWLTEDDADIFRAKPATPGLIE